MPYESRTGGRRFGQDPASQGIFIHGGTCLNHSPGDPFPQRAEPNRFVITWPIIEGTYSFATASTYPPCRTFNEAVRLAEKVRESHPVIWHAGIYACTDLILRNRHSADTRIQIVSRRLHKRAAAHVEKPQAVAA
jgi:hypothetical protein